VIGGARGRHPGSPKKRNCRADQHCRGRVFSEKIEAALDPAADGVAAAVDDGIDEVLRFVLLFRRYPGEESLPSGSDESLFTRTADDHHDDQDRKHP
jgi:hypothetical protein